MLVNCNSTQGGKTIALKISWKVQIFPRQEKSQALPHLWILHTPVFQFLDFSGCPEKVTTQEKGSKPEWTCGHVWTWAVCPEEWECCLPPDWLWHCRISMTPSDRPPRAPVYSQCQCQCQSINQLKLTPTGPRHYQKYISYRYFTAHVQQDSSCYSPSYSAYKKSR